MPVLCAARGSVVREVACQGAVSFTTPPPASFAPWERAWVKEGGWCSSKLSSGLGSPPHSQGNPGCQLCPTAKGTGTMPKVSWVFHATSGCPQGSPHWLLFPCFLNLMWTLGHRRWAVCWLAARVCRTFRKLLELSHRFFLGHSEVNFEALAVGTALCYANTPLS